MLYVASLDHHLTKCGLGFDLSYTEEGSANIRHIPAWFYADNIVLLANNPDELQDLLDIRGEGGLKARLNFQRQKVSGDDLWTSATPQDPKDFHPRKTPSLDQWVQVSEDINHICPKLPAEL
ncbi:hypothetical protein MRX96_029890 [Rhipicephalus microplus]